MYLKVGLPKSWILQYCLSGGAGPIAAPWPFVRVRPNVPTAVDAGYVIVRGSLDAEGRFERLALVAPAQLNGSDALLAALEQWEFRPAARNGRRVAVEVLLIIPPAAEEEN
ncbi:MAG TPA: hypothetical protein VN610_05805 [Bryobacteraceae bacterium]|nr:hypothetical protein [Bryobacteraceae bacterium]